MVLIVVGKIMMCVFYLMICFKMYFCILSHNMFKVYCMLQVKSIIAFLEIPYVRNNEKSHCQNSTERYRSKVKKRRN